jgi:hypothetical protein
MSELAVTYRFYWQLLLVNIAHNNGHINSLEDREKNVFMYHDDGKYEYLPTREILEKLQEEQKYFGVITASTMLLGIAGCTMAVPAILITLIPLALSKLSVEYFTRFSRLCKAVEMLYQEFGDDGIKIALEVKTDFGIIDLFVKMPDKRSFALILRTNGENFIQWQQRENRQGFYIFRKGKGCFKSWDTTMKILENFSDQTSWLQKTKSPVLGASSAERKKPIIRAIVLTGGTRLGKIHQDPATKVDFGQTKVVKIETDYTTYLLESEDLIKFLLPKSD